MSVHRPRRPRRLGPDVLRAGVWLGLIGGPAALCLLFPDGAMTLGLSPWAWTIALVWLFVAVLSTAAVEAWIDIREAEEYRRTHPHHDFTADPPHRHNL